MKILTGNELAEYIKNRQAKEARSLYQANNIRPALAIVQSKEDKAISIYTNLKKRYGGDIGIDVNSYFIDQQELPAKIKSLNNDPKVYGVIVQLPLADPSQTEAIVNLISPSKDVDALGEKAEFEPATPMAILWLLVAYNVDLNGKKVVLVGRGKLVGAPLDRILRKSGIDVTVVDKPTANLADFTQSADVIITATGSPAILKSDMIKQGAVVVDAGVATESGKLVGDLAPDVYERQDLTITPVKGGVGPLTVCALFDNVIRAARRVASQSDTSKQI
jgi:methylenetetrahydrofolate dehydrogenase (NADP+)/methenyltetrahydrofolate cyclohydrolase